MDLLIEKNDGSKAFISQFKVLVTEFEESAPVVKRNNTELDQRNGAIDFGGWHDSKEIKLTAIYKADGMDEEERLREKIYALLSDPDGYYITQFKTSPLKTLQRPGETTGDYFDQLTNYPSHKRFNVYASEIDNEFQGRIGNELLYKLAVTFKTLWLPYGETPARDVVLNENKVSSVGVNLLTGTSGELKSGTTPAGHEDGGQEATNGFQYAVNAGETYTYQVYVGKENMVDAHVLIGAYDENKNWYDIIGQGNTVLANTGGVSEVTFTIPDAVRYINLTPLGFSAQSTDILVYWKAEKLEKGSVATDWCPNPADANYNSWLYDINSVAIKYIGTVPCNQLEQGFRIRFTAIQEADHLDLSMNGETVTYSDTVHYGDVFEFAGFSYKLNELSVTNKVTKSYYTLKPNGENILSCNITGKFEILKFQNLYA